MIIPFATQSYRSDSLPISAQRCVNMYAEMQAPNSKTQVAVFGAPGITSFATCGSGPIRALHVFKGVVYAVSGGFLYSVSSAGVVTQLGGQIDGSGLVSIANNGAQIGIVNGVNGWIYSASGGFVRITDVGFNAANSITFLDQFFLFDHSGTAQIFRSKLLDGTDYSEGAFATKEANPDNVLVVRNLKEILHVLGVDSSELWANSGIANFPFQRLPGGTINRGILGSHAFAEADEALFILGADRIAYRLSGAQLGRISTHAIEEAWQQYTSTSDAFGVSYTWNGHKFVTFTFPSQSVIPGLTNSWTWDVASNLWHERESRDINGQALGRWCGNCAIEVKEPYNKVLIGDAFSGQIGYLDKTAVSEFGRPMYAEAVAPVLHADQARAFMRKYELDIENGVGLPTGQGVDPQIMLDISDDGGRTWSYPQSWRSMGRLGAYRQRLRWFKLGNFYQRVMRITISDPVPRRILRSVADLNVGMS